MAYELSYRLVIGLASSALFDLSESDKIFREQGEEAYRKFQSANENHPFDQGVAFPFIKRLLSVNEISPDNPPVEVVLLSRNDPHTGMRVMKSIQYYGLGITRAVFLQGKTPYRYIPALSVNLFLSANEADVNQAIIAGYPAGRVLDSSHADIIDDHELRVAFDFDGVIIDDEAEIIFQQTKDLREFHANETQKAATPHNPGPLKIFFEKLSILQKKEKDKAKTDPAYKPKIRISIVTARNAPSHERVINTIQSWGIMVDEAFFLGGIEKKRVLEVLAPHIFFDDQELHLEQAAKVLPSVHIPFGIANKKQQSK
jgi:5'-nucleotidase